MCHGAKREHILGRGEVESYTYLNFGLELFLTFLHHFFSFALITCSLIFWCSQGHGFTSFANKAKYFLLAFFPSDSELLHILPPAALAHLSICYGQCLPAPFPRFSLFNHRPWNAWAFGSCFDGQLMVPAVWR